MEQPEYHGEYHNAHRSLEPEKQNPRNMLRLRRMDRKRVSESNRRIRVLEALEALEAFLQNAHTHWLLLNLNLPNEGHSRS